MKLRAGGQMSASTVERHNQEEFDMSDRQDNRYVSQFPPAAAFACFNLASSPVTTNFALTCWIACVHCGVVFQGN